MNPNPTNTNNPDLPLDSMGMLIPKPRDDTTSVVKYEPPAPQRARCFLRIDPIKVHPPNPESKQKHRRKLKGGSRRERQEAARRDAQGRTQEQRAIAATVKGTVTVFREI